MEPPEKVTGAWGWSLQEPCPVTWKAGEKLSGSTAEISALFRDIPTDTQ